MEEWNQSSLFDLIPEDDPMRIALTPIPSTDWKWSFKDYPPKNGLKVFSCFACGGGATKGYKLAGCDVVGCCEIDKRMNDAYVRNHNPRFNYLMDIRDFNKLDDLPQELYELDILDGSPPCSTFSMLGKREKAWGVEMKFKEGQKLQTLDDLPFVMIDTVDKLKPKVVIIENVEGLLLGNAWEYVKEIHTRLRKIGYSVRMELLKGEDMGVPQTRHRVFIIATRLDFDLQTVDLRFFYAPVFYGEFKDNKGEKVGGKMGEALSQAIETDRDFSDIYKRIEGKDKGFGHRLVHNNEIMPTVLAGHRDLYDFENRTRVSTSDIICAQTFPQDYDFGEKKYSTVEYLCGMSVPPLMIKRIVTRLIESGIFEKEAKNAEV